MTIPFNIKKISIRQKTTMDFDFFFFVFAFMEYLRSCLSTITFPVVDIIHSKKNFIEKAIKMAPAIHFRGGSQSFS